MMNIRIKDFVPQFIMNDKNGRAMAKAIETGLKCFLKVVQEGVDTWGNVDRMPEWRLDEMAWELNCLYDHTATISQKRNWIRYAIPMYRIWGTPNAICSYLEGFFDAIDIEENWEYGGEPYHFRVTVEGEWTAENEAWARRAIQTAKNVRSVLDSLRIGHKCLMGITAEAGVLTKFAYPLTGAANYAGRWPQENLLVAVEESHAGMEIEAAPYTIPYPLTGTVPNTNLLGEVEESYAGVAGEVCEQVFGYPMTSGDIYAGTVPQVNLLAEKDHPVIPSAQADDMIIEIPYKLCGQDEL